MRMLSNNMISALSLAVLLLSTGFNAMIANAAAFLTLHKISKPLSNRITSIKTKEPHSSLKLSSTNVPSATMGKGKTLVVISPPGGLGEIITQSAAKTGATVRWFIVSPDSSSSSSNTIPLSSWALSAIQKAGGSIELAGSDAASLLLPPEEPGSAVPAVAAWCNAGGAGVDGLVCSYDGADDVDLIGSSVDDSQNEVAQRAVRDATKVASREASKSLVRDSMKVVILPVDSDEGDTSEDEEDEGGAFGMISGLFGSKVGSVPSGLLDAVKGGIGGVTVLRHGELFGLPESAPNASPFAGGPRREPSIREEYALQSVRIDPTISSSGIQMATGDSTRSSRLTLGMAAALMATGGAGSSSLIQNPANSIIDISLTSLRSLEPMDLEEWSDEFKRVSDFMAAAADKTGSGSKNLFSASFGSVPDVNRLTDWFATKWAPAVLRTYDLASIRVGARPVFVNKLEGSNTVEIVWQELKDFKTITVGKMLIDIKYNGLVAYRGPGDGREGFGVVSTKPLAGEDVLVRRLSEGVSQAIEKGLATKPKTPKRKKEEPQVQVVETGTILDSGDVVPPPKPASSRQGPRTAGARRSSERARGRKRRRAPTPSATSDGPAKKKEEGTGGKGENKPEAWQ